MADDSEVSEVKGSKNIAAMLEAQKAGNTQAKKDAKEVIDKQKESIEIDKDNVGKLAAEIKKQGGVPEENKKYQKSNLEIQRKELATQRNELKLRQKNAPYFPDEADRATHEEGFTLELKTRERERRLLNKIDSSLEAIKDNIYGYCNSCSIEIGIRRLEARPTATRCIDCKTLEEIHERQQYG